MCSPPRRSTHLGLTETAYVETVHHHKMIQENHAEEDMSAVSKVPETRRGSLSMRLAPKTNLRGRRLKSKLVLLSSSSAMTATLLVAV